MGYRFLDKVAIADTAFEAEAPTLPELFATCAEATFAVMVDLSTVTPSEERRVELTSPSLDRLLFDWLAELIYLKDRDYFVFSRFEVKIEQNEQWRLQAVAGGEKIKPEKQRLLTDVKAVTYHMFEVKKQDGGWLARVVLDT